METITKTETCLEIDEHTSEALQHLDTYYQDGLITKEELAAKVAYYIQGYVLNNDVILVKIIHTKKGE